MRKRRSAHCRQRATRNHGIDYCHAFAKSHDFGEPSSFAESFGFGESHADGYQDSPAGETAAEEDSASPRTAETFDDRAYRRACAHHTGQLLSAQ
ncbi:MAG: hypothetical protein ACRDOB_08040 [Streptosporangiaceae bacterium]